MEPFNHIITILGAVIGSGGIAAVITALVSVKKYKAEAYSIRQQADNDRRESENRMNESIRKQIMEISNIHKKESDELRAQNAELSHQIEQLNNKIHELIEWAVYDNAKYRAWLENELVKLKPDIEFPECRPLPGCVVDATRNKHFDHSSDNETSEQ